MIYVLATELLHVEPLPFASHLQKIALYALIPHKRRLDKAAMYLQRAMASEEKYDPNVAHLLNKAAAQKCKPMMPEILAKRSMEHHYTAFR